MQNEQTWPVLKTTKDPRVTVLGRLLRETSLEELPQFWNVQMVPLTTAAPTVLRSW